MTKLYNQKETEKLLNNKFIVIIGSSVQRSMYKDLIKLLTKDCYLNDRELRSKGEQAFQTDQLICGGVKGRMVNSTAYREVREFKTDFHLIRFYFISKCYNKYVESVVEELNQEPKPDVVLLNSCLWDITRHGTGTTVVDNFRQNLHQLFTKLKQVLPPYCIVMWNSTLPVDKEAKGGVFVPEVEAMKSQLGPKILACNLLTQYVIKQYGYDYIDLHYFLRYHLHRRAEDGVHWDMTAHRRITNLILCHIAEAWGSMNSTEEPTRPELPIATNTAPSIALSIAPSISSTTAPSVAPNTTSNIGPMKSQKFRRKRNRNPQYNRPNRLGSRKGEDYNNNIYGVNQENQYFGNFYEENQHPNNQCAYNEEDFTTDNFLCNPTQFTNIFNSFEPKKVDAKQFKEYHWQEYPRQEYPHQEYPHQEYPQQEYPQQEYPHRFGSFNPNIRRPTQ